MNMKRMNISLFCFFPAMAVFSWRFSGGFPAPAATVFVVGHATDTTTEAGVV
jgi:hypothetical protein